MTRVPFTTTWIEANRILAGSIPQLPEDLVALKDLRVDYIISLTRRDFRTYPDMPQMMFNVSHFSIPDGGIASDEIMFGAAKDIDFAYQNKFTIYVHCRGGIGRTGMILLAYYVLHRGLTLEQAKEIVKMRRNWEGNASAIEQGSPQKEWIDSLESRR